MFIKISRTGIIGILAYAGMTMHGFANDCQTQCANCSIIRNKSLCIQNCPGNGPSSNQIMECIRKESVITSSSEANESGNLQLKGLKWIIFQKMPNLKYYFGEGNPEKYKDDESPSENELKQLIVVSEQLREPCVKVIQNIKSSVSAIKRNNPFGETSKTIKQLEANLTMITSSITEMKNSGMQKTRSQLRALSDGKLNLATKTCVAQGASFLFAIKSGK